LTAIIHQHLLRRGPSSPTVMRQVYAVPSMLPVRPRRSAQPVIQVTRFQVLIVLDQHGNNALVGGGLWTGVTPNSRPYAFIRGWTGGAYHRPLRSSEFTTGSAN